jgi:hypothetical protein
MKRIAGACARLALLVALAVPAGAQVSSGIIAGTIKDEQGGVLSGVTVTLSGSDRAATCATASDGRFRFLNLPPGAYTVTADLAGFSRVIREDLIVSVGSHLDLGFNMRVATVQETITVSGESPIVDSKAMGTATNFTQAELDKIPTSRDPWALLRTVPGVMVDRVNIAGNETGQQSNLQSKGTRPADTVWTLDGVVVTDMASIGLSPAYFNYDNFEEIQISTTGQDIKQPTGGVGLNFVLKRGTNAYRGGVRGFFTNDTLEASNVPDELKVLGVTPDTADHNEQISDYGFELGGPIVRDRAWFYGSWSKQDIRLVRSSGNYVDKTILANINAKGNWQATSKDMVSVLWYLYAKDKTGRSPGFGGITRDAETATWFQGGSYVEGKPHGLTKIEDNHVFNSNLFLSAQYAYYNTGFGLEPMGGMEMQAGHSQVLNQSFGSTLQSRNIRPQHILNVDANHFYGALGASHDLKFGFGYRRTDAFTGTLWPGNMILAMQNNTNPAGGSIARIYREGAGSNRTEYLDFYAGDTISKGRLTLDFGLRYDRQWGEALPSATKPNAAFPEVMPGVNFTGYDSPFTWNNVSPRAGITFALDDSHRTILRASYSRYAGQLDTGIVGYSNPSQNVGFVEYWWNDLNADHFVQQDEVDFAHFVTQGGGFNPAAPTAVTSANIIDPNLRAPVTQSAVIGIDRELVQNLAVQVNYSFTRSHNYAGTGTFTPWIGLTASDYAPGPLLTGTLANGEAFNIQTWLPDGAKITAHGNGRILKNYEGYSSRYNGVELSLIKRMSERWMARVGAAWNHATEHYSTNPPRDSIGNPTPLDTEPLDSGGPFTVRSSASGIGDMFIHGRWQLSANALYILPGEVELGASLFGRQGYPYPVYRDVTLGRDSSRRVLVSPELDSIRHDDLWNLDMRVARSFRLGNTTAQFIADLFNVFNANTVLVRNRNIDSPSFGRIAQNLSPRIVRFGARVGF